MNLGKEYDKVDREALWDVLKFMVWQGSYGKEIRHFIKKQVHD